jgi:rubredoxin
VTNTKKSIEATGQISEEMLCQNCKTKKKSNNGSWLVFDGGLRRKWKCKECTYNVQKPKATKSR